MTTHGHLPRLALLCGALLGCDAAGAPADAPDWKTVEGPWHVSRTIRTQPSGCRVMSLPELEVTFRVGGAPAITVVGATLEPWDQEVTRLTAAFVTEEHPFVGEPWRPALVAHDVAWVNQLLVGTALSRGDGDDLGCTWQIDVQATPIYD